MLEEQQLNPDVIVPFGCGVQRRATFKGQSNHDLKGPRRPDDGQLAQELVFFLLLDSLPSMGKAIPVHRCA